MLGITAYWASIFLPDVRRTFPFFLPNSTQSFISFRDSRRLLDLRTHHPFTDDTIVISRVCASFVQSYRQLTLFPRLQWSTPRTEAFFLFVVGVLWLGEFVIASGKDMPTVTSVCEYSYGSMDDVSAFSKLPDSFVEVPSMYSDIIGNTQCDAQTSQTVPTHNGGTRKSTWTTVSLKLIVLFSVCTQLVLRDACCTGILVDDLLPLFVPFPFPVQFYSSTLTPTTTAPQTQSSCTFSSRSLAARRLSVACTPGRSLSSSCPGSGNGRATPRASTRSRTACTQGSTRTPPASP